MDAGQISKLRMMHMVKGAEMLDLRIVKNLRNRIDRRARNILRLKPAIPFVARARLKMPASSIVSASKFAHAFIAGLESLINGKLRPLDAVNRPSQNLSGDRKMDRNQADRRHT